MKEKNLTYNICSSARWKRNVFHFVDCGQLNVGFFPESKLWIALNPYCILLQSATTIQQSTSEVILHLSAFVAQKWAREVQDSVFWAFSTWCPKNGGVSWLFPNCSLLPAEKAVGSVGWYPSMKNSHIGKRNFHPYPCTKIQQTLQYINISNLKTRLSEHLLQFT